MSGWHPGQLLFSRLVDRPLPGGYVIRQSTDPNLVVPYYIDNANTDRRDQARISIFAFPSSVAGTILGGIPGTVVGYVVGAGLGYLREARLRGRPPV
jgi:hypothetical protein